MKGYIKSVKNAALGDTLENALEQGEKYIGFMSKWKKVSCWYACENALVMFILILP